MRRTHSQINIPAGIVVVIAALSSPAHAIDTDGDGIDDRFDVCCDTPMAAAVDLAGRSVGDDDTDCDVDLDDYQLLHATLDLHEFSVLQRNFTGALAADLPCHHVCGNALVEMEEECDPPNGLTCDRNCRVTINGLPVNNSCTRPTPIREGAHFFSTQGASTDGPDEPQACAIDGYTQADADLWWCFQPTHTETVTVSLCGSAFDTKLFVYAGCSCPTSAPIACSDDDCGAGSDSRISVNMVAASQYLIRIGGFEGDQGVGRLTIFGARNPLRGDEACNDFTGDCFSAHELPGCNSAIPCASTCAVDQSCCDVAWNGICAEQANGIINGFSACGTSGAGPCLTANPGTQGCDNTACCQTVCMNDPFCCLTEWDAACAGAAAGNCGP